MSDVQHPISLINVVFTRVHVQAIPQHKHEGEAYIGPVENQLSVKESPDERRTFLAVMQTNVNKAANPDHPYVIDVECHAAFHAEDTLSDEDASKGVMITAHSVLYGAIRETVAWLTGRQPHGPIMLGLSILSSKAE
jgi:preprotein translocase subunit SecB